MTQRPIIVVDNGSYQCRAGFSNQDNPCLVFKNVLAKLRNKDRGRKEVEIQVGNDIENLDQVRFALKSQFDKNVMVNVEVQESILDYMFSSLRLGPKDNGVGHPILMTEAFLNPNYCRHILSELLFETYQVPAVAYGVDALFSFNKNYPDAQDGLIVSFGYHTIEILPYLNGKVDPANSRRINIGGCDMIHFLHRLLQLKYPAHVNTITIGKVEDILHTHGYVSSDYAEELQKWTNNEFYNEYVLRLKLPTKSAPPSSASTATSQHQNDIVKERRKEVSKRMTEANARKREEKLAEDEERLEILNDIKRLVEESGDAEEIDRALSAAGVTSLAELTQAIRQLMKSIRRIKTWKAERSPGTNNDGEPKAKSSKDSCSGSDIPENKEEFKAWLAETHLKRTELLRRQAIRRQKRSELAKRKTAASQERMRLLTELAKKEKYNKNDTFGMNDEDWDVYKAIRKGGGGSDSEDDAERLNDLEQILRKHDPNFEKELRDLEEDDELHVGLEKTRGPELVFQPSMIGEGQGGVHQTLEFVLKLYPQEIQTRLVTNIFLTGGLASLPGMLSRMETQVLEMRPFESTFKVAQAQNPVLDPWYGMLNWARSQEADIVKHFVTKAEYDERGGEYFKQHPASNKYYPSPHSVVSSSAMHKLE